jgi:hypothetical protein
MPRFFLCPETGGKTLEQVDYLFGSGLDVKDTTWDDAQGSWEEEKSDTQGDRVEQPTSQA